MDKFTPCGGPSNNEETCKLCGKKWNRYRGGSWDWEYKDCPSCAAKAAVAAPPNASKALKWRGIDHSMRCVSRTGDPCDCSMPLVRILDLERRLAALERVVEVGRTGVGAWMSAALDDPKVCAEMKADINAWFAAYEALDALDQKKSQ